MKKKVFYCLCICIYFLPVWPMKRAQTMASVRHPQVTGRPDVEDGLDRGRSSGEITGGPLRHVIIYFETCPHIFRRKDFLAEVLKIQGEDEAYQAAEEDLFEGVEFRCPLCCRKGEKPIRLKGRKPGLFQRPGRAHPSESVSTIDDEEQRDEVVGRVRSCLGVFCRGVVAAYNELACFSTPQSQHKE